MLDMLKKIGLNATIAAVISAFITIIPFLFKIDERYAKEDEVKAQFDAVDKQIAGLTVEAGKLAGTQQVLVAVISAKNDAPVTPQVAAKPPVEISTVPPKTKAEATQRLEQVTQQLQSTQRNLTIVGDIKPEKMVGEARAEAAFKK